MGWLLAEDTPAVRHVALRDLCDRPPDDLALCRARVAAMDVDPISAILAAQHSDGWWSKPGVGYAPKYRATAWQIIFLDQLGADPDDERVRAGCRYILDHAASPGGGFGHASRNASSAPPPSAVLNCINGNLLGALVGLGWLDDPRVRQAIAWQAGSITGSVAGSVTGTVTYHRSGTSGPGFACGYNDGQPCAWGAIKALAGLVRVPAGRRDAAVTAALDAGAAFLLSRDPAVADYPMGHGNTRPSTSWFKLGFPSGYVADVLQNLEVLVALGYGRDSRLAPALDWVLSKQDNATGRWRNEYAYNGKTWIDIERQGQPSRWVTLRVCRLLKRVAQSP